MVFTDNQKENYLDRWKKTMHPIVFVFGLFLLIASFWLLWWNESNSLDKIKSTGFSIDIIRKLENHYEEDIFTNWYYRIGGFLMMWGGLFFLFQPLSKILSCIPLLKDIAELDVPFIYATAAMALMITATTITIFWLRYRPLDYIGIVVLILYMFYFIHQKAKKARQQKQ